MITKENIIPLNDVDRLKKEIDTGKYKKLLSTVQLNRINLPTLPGFVIKKLDKNSLDYIKGWMHKTNSNRLSLRFDSSNPEDNKRLISCNPTISELLSMKNLINNPIIGIVLAENDRYNQNHSVLTQFRDDYIHCEIVGPGFDASDLTRGNTIPHETVEIYRKSNHADSSYLEAIDIRRHVIVGEKAYTQTRNIKYGLISSVIHQGFGKDLVATRADSNEVDNFLETRGTSIPESYEPIGYQRLNELYKYIYTLDKFRNYFNLNFGIDIKNRVLSASFLKKYGLVFWDIYGGDKYRKK